MFTGSITVYPDSPDSFSVELKPGQVLEIGRRTGEGDTRRLVIPAPEVSGHHADISPTRHGWTIRDAGSTNGTKLNGDRLTPGREYLLRSGDRIKIAHVDLLVHLPDCDGDITREQEEQEQTHLRINLINATILVGDIRGFTTLMERYAETPGVVMLAAQAVFRPLQDEIRRNYGELEKIAGDAIMAYWQSAETASSAHHAFQACQTALKLKALVAELARREDTWPFVDHQLELDMALATGPVAAGMLGHAEANPALIGDTANLAYHLEKLIPESAPGAIVVDGATHTLAAGHFDFQWLGSFNIKGRQRQVELYQLVGPKGEPQRA